MLTMDQALDKAARANAELKVLLVDMTTAGIIEFFTSGASGTLGGESQANIGVHFAVGKAEAARYIAQIDDVTPLMNERDVRLVYFFNEPD